MSKEETSVELTRLRELNVALTDKLHRQAEQFDAQHGTPCEQIRHAQEVEALQADIARKDEALRDALFCLELTEKRANPTWDGRASPASAIGKARAALHPLAPGSKEPNAIDETGWLIELRGPHPTWWSLALNEEPGWTTDSLEAIRFARKEDAEAYINDIGWTDAFTTEHAWIWDGKPVWFKYRQDWPESCKFCGIVRRADDKNSPCKGRVSVGPKSLSSKGDAAGHCSKAFGADRVEREAQCRKPWHMDDGVPYCDECGLFRDTVAGLSARLNRTFDALSSKGDAS